MLSVRWSGITQEAVNVTVFRFPTFEYYKHITVEHLARSDL